MKSIILTRRYKSDIMTMFYYLFIHKLHIAKLKLILKKRSVGIYTDAKRDKKHISKMYLVCIKYMKVYLFN